MKVACFCRHTPGATCGLPKLTAQERAFLLQYDFEISTNAHGDEISRPKSRTYFNSARSDLHQALCRRPKRFQRVGVAEG